MPLQSQEIELPWHVYVCLGYQFCLCFWYFLFNYETILTFWYCLFFILLNVVTWVIFRSLFVSIKFILKKVQKASSGLKFNRILVISKWPSQLTCLLIKGDKTVVYFICPRQWLYTHTQNASANHFILLCCTFCKPCNIRTR